MFPVRICYVTLTCITSALTSISTEVLLQCIHTRTYIYTLTTIEEHIFNVIPFRTHLWRLNDFQVTRISKHSRWISPRPKSNSTNSSSKYVLNIFFSIRIFKQSYFDGQIVCNGRKFSEHQIFRIHLVLLLSELEFVVNCAVCGFVKIWIFNKKKTMTHVNIRRNVPENQRLILFNESLNWIGAGPFESRNSIDWRKQ